MDTQPPPSTPMMGCLTRLFWMFAGNAALVFCLVYIARGPGRALTLFDAAYVLLVASLVLARWVEIQFYAGEAASGGTAATMGEWRRYTAIVVALAAVAWLGVRAVLWARGA